jgi:hypothetical protein
MKLIRFILLFEVMYFTLTGMGYGQISPWGTELYDQIKRLSLDGNKVAEVESLVLVRDAAVFRLNQGKVCLSQPVNGKVIGAVFVGEGVFEFTPPNDIERYQLNRFTKQDSLNESFDELFLLFSDTTDQELEHRLIFSPGEVPGRFKSIISNCPEHIVKETGSNLWCRLLQDVLADSSSSPNSPDQNHGFLYADVKTRQLGRFFFTFDPKRVEETTLDKPDNRPGVSARDRICSFNRKEDYLQKPSDEYAPIPHENKDEIRIDHYQMTVVIDLQERLSANVEIDFESLADGGRALNFDVHRDIRIEKITDETGDSLPFVKEDDQYDVAVILPRPMKAGETHKLNFKYHGKEMILQDWYGDLYMKSSTNWYPRYGYQKVSTFDVTYKCPKSYKLASVGEKTKEWVEGDSLCTQWVEDIPVRAVSFTYGNLKTYDRNVEGVPKVCVYYQGFKKSKESVATDVVNSLNYFQTMYGKCPFPSMLATEIPTSVGQGLPGLLRLSWGTFIADEQSHQTEFEETSFRAHEVSHQWWGHVLGWDSYHDQWLSEGFAEFSGMWFAHLSIRDKEVFHDKLKEWRDDILGKGGKWQEGSKVGPVWLGFRLNSSKSQDYADLIYEKGAYVLYMLRNLMMDYDNNNDDRFFKMMADFVETYRGHNVSTADFQAIVEKHMEEKMDWFFDQWVYGTEIPTYDFSYTVDETPEGKYVVKCQVTQENVSKDFKMWVPVLLDFGGDQYAALRLLVDKPENKFELPKAPLKPKKVTLNPWFAVLCEVKNK